MQVSGKVAVITGGARGFGKRLAEVLIEKGARVVLADILEEGFDVAVALNAQHGKKVAVFHTCDVRNFASLASLIPRALEEFGSFDIMVNNAGIEGSVPWTDADGEGISRTIDINLKAPIEGTRLAVKHFNKSKKQGCVVNVASMMAFFPMEFGPAYGATKSGVVNFTASCATLAKLSPPIHVNAVAPNFADTAMIKGQLSQGNNVFLKMNGILTVDEVVKEMVRCVEDESLAGDTIKLLAGHQPLVHNGRKAMPSGIITQPKL
ncbi:15-hydroxyprostaglandin dehydrogenase [Martensiomyces pterosporus]|nr:15-hydroxyprostaglandin dehydrogenase [Martensiomyces pterosporus]